MVHDIRFAPRRRTPRRSPPAPPERLWERLALAVAVGALGFWALVFAVAAAGGGSRYSPREQAFLAAQGFAMSQLARPNLTELDRYPEAEVVPLEAHLRTWEVRSWVAGANRLGYPLRQAYTAQVYCPEGARRFTEWQLMALRWE